MGMIYLVRKKLFQTKEGAKQLYYAVQRTLQPRGGVTEDILAKRIAHRTGRSEGDVKGILADLPHFIEEALKNGESVSIKGLGSCLLYTSQVSKTKGLTAALIASISSVNCGSFTAQVALS